MNPTIKMAAARRRENIFFYFPKISLPFRTLSVSSFYFADKTFPDRSGKKYERTQGWNVACLSYDGGSLSQDFLSNPNPLNLFNMCLTYPHEQARRSLQTCHFSLGNLFYGRSSSSNSTILSTATLLSISLPFSFPEILSPSFLFRRDFFHFI